MMNYTHALGDIKHFLVMNLHHYNATDDTYIIDETVSIQNVMLFKKGK